MFLLKCLLSYNSNQHGWCGWISFTYTMSWEMVSSLIIPATTIFQTFNISWVTQNVRQGCQKHIHKEMVIYIIENPKIWTFFFLYRKKNSTHWLKCWISYFFFFIKHLYCFIHLPFVLWESSLLFLTCHL